MAATWGLIDALFYNSGVDYDTPTLVKIDEVENVGLSDERNTGTLKLRKYDTEMAIVGQRKMALTFNMLANPGDTVWDYLHNAYLNKTAVDVFAFYKYTDNAGAPTAGDKAVRFFGLITKFSRDQNLEEPDMNELEIVPTCLLQGVETEVHEPEIYTAA